MVSSPLAETNTRTVKQELTPHVTRASQVQAVAAAASARAACQIHPKQTLTNTPRV